MEDVQSDDDVFKKLQRVMDEEGSDVDSEEEKEEKHDADEQDDSSDLSSEVEREMAVDDNDEEEEEEEEEGEEDIEKLKKDIEQHRKDMEALKERDPKFYKFLEAEDKELLDFDESDDGLDADDDDQQYSDMEEPEETIIQDTAIVLNKNTVNEWVETIKTTKDFKAFKKLLSAFRTAARMAEDEDDKAVLTYKIEDPAVFSKVITCTLRFAPVVFSHHLKPKKESELPITSGRWNFFKSYVKTYLNNLLHLLRNLTDADMLRLTIREAEKCTKFFVCFDRLAKDYLKTLLNAYSSLTSTDTVRIQAFLSIKSLSISSIPVIAKGKNKGVSSEKPQGYLDICLKNVYLSFVKNSKTTNAHTLPTINLMRNLAVQLYGINPVLSYQQGFVYVRQLAIHLRQAMKVRSTKNHNTVYNWQYIHCIDFWADVLNTFSNSMMVTEEGEQVESPLKSLLYPFTQVAVGVIQLIPTAQFYPLRFHIIRTLTSLIRNTNIFIPLATFILEVLEGSVAREKAKKSNTGLPTEWELVLKVNKKNVHTRMYQDEVLNQCAIALKNYYKEYIYHISFPEMVDADIVAIKRFVKHSHSLKGKEKLHTLAKELEAKASFVRQQRSKINFSPSNEDEIKQFSEDLKAKLT
ncbi:Noc2p family-domain-containing protein [Cokeromyces recurvatus]|uniref:Noc2p family-domain-containing protein n=1 Tax=Cokeromyces recurvatus TaxID=90255 RepID=UPI00221E3B53|nr:Noc2p family-domain-containing protein [Cokeromyces recurvatus]KAI7899002.1 Noc2p family-domain-containing protein [Cokeromyces recurvatus]